MEYKYSTINEVNHFEFGEAVVGDIQLTDLSGKFLQPRHPDDAYQ